VSTAVITGAGSGIGRAIAAELAKQDHEIIIVEVDETAGEESAAAIREAGGSARLVPCDISQTDSVRAAFDQIDSLDILINNAGIASVGNVEACTPEEMDRIYEVNVKGMYHCLHFAVPKMVTSGGGCVVNLASVASYLGISDRFAYSMSKGAVLSMTMSIARDYIDRGIRCNCVCPGRVHTPFVDGYLAKNYSEEERPEMLKTLSEWQPIGRMGTPGEIAGLVSYLTSDRAGFITGSAFEIDGGVTNLR
jgi:NAD(P)-dependent dehydrogenase (short-subunit alcohol dehydrogenase family)|tara:strand:+ start:12023 stop:12772 length:750 start_codon:yes stop_codon:yes gene_type:complete